MIILIVIGVLLFDMTYFINQQERGVVLRFGGYSKTWQPGLNFRLPTPIEEVIQVNVEQVRPLTHKATMLTQDENIVDVEVAVQWKIKDPAEYLFNVNQPAATLRQVTESAVREIIGKAKLDYVLTEGRGQIAQSLPKVVGNFCPFVVLEMFGSLAVDSLDALAGNDSFQTVRSATSTANLLWMPAAIIDGLMADLRMDAGRTPI